tara:strand:+ start:83 stop:451 length:369 start_codon:yes stop_codon:yes gene_type:complete
MVALVKDKDNFTKKQELSSNLEIVAIKREYRYVNGWNLVFSIKCGDLFVSAKNFARKTWSTYWKAVEALEKIIAENEETVFFCDPKLDICSIQYEKEHRYNSKDLTEYGTEIKTYYLNTLFG